MDIRWEGTEKGIKLTDNHGNDLMQVLPDEEKSRIKYQKEHQFKQSFDDLKYKIISYDVISFDIFDTLITRRVLEPGMVFDYVARFAVHNDILIDDFHREREKAQLESGLNNPNLDEIYEQLSINTGITKEQTELLKHKELSCEKQVIVPRYDMVSLFYYALEAQKKVYLTTDMYLNRRYIVSLLNNCGISGYYDILDSCEYRKLKLEGLFDELKAINPGKKILHIGDNYINDCICAEISGIDSYLIPKGIDIAKKKKTSPQEWMDSAPRRFIAGSQISYTYNSPFVHDKGGSSEELADRMKLTKTFNEKKWFDIGYSYMGPIILSLVGWILKEIPINRYDGVLLSARDGYLLNKVFSILKEHEILDDKISIHYFYISRKAAVAMHTDEEAIINMLIDRTSPYYLPDRLLREVFCMEKDRIKPYILNEYGDERYKYVWDQYKEIKDNVYRLRRNFYRYLGDEGLRIGGRYLFYDFVSSGTVHRALSPIVPFELDGVYYQFTGEKDFQGKLYSKFSRDNRVLRNNYKMMESLMLSPEPSLWGYDNNGKTILCKEQKSGQILPKTTTVHKGTLTYVKDFLNCFNLDDAIISDEEILELIQKMGKQIGRTNLEKDLIDDWFMGNRKKQK